MVIKMCALKIAVNVYQDLYRASSRIFLVYGAWGCCVLVYQCGMKYSGDINRMKKKLQLLNEMNMCGSIKWV